MNKYIQRNALANEIITIKRFTTFYVIYPSARPLPSVSGPAKEQETFLCVASAVTINTQFPRIIRENLTSC